MFTAMCIIVFVFICVCWSYERRIKRLETELIHAYCDSTAYADDPWSRQLSDASAAKAAATTTEYPKKWEPPFNVVDHVKRPAYADHGSYTD
jgi:hypothetical protein